MATLQYTYQTSTREPLNAALIVGYGAHAGAALPAEGMRLLLDDLIEDLLCLRRQMADARSADLLDTIALGLAASASVVTYADLCAFPGWPGDVVIAETACGDGYDALRWLASLVQRAGGMQ